MLPLVVRESVPLFGLSRGVTVLFERQEVAFILIFIPLSFLNQKLTSFVSPFLSLPSITSLYFESDIFPASFMSSYIVRLLTFLLLTIAVFC